MTKFNTDGLEDAMKAITLFGETNKLWEARYMFGIYEEDIVVVNFKYLIHNFAPIDGEICVNYKKKTIKLRCPWYHPVIISNKNFNTGFKKLSQIFESISEFIMSGEEVEDIWEQTYVKLPSVARTTYD